MPTDHTSDEAGDGDGRDRREESASGERGRGRDDPGPERRPRSPGADRGSDSRSDGDAQQRRRYEPVGRPRREVAYGSDRSRRARDADRRERGPDRDAWSILDGDLRERRDESSNDPDGASAAGGDDGDEGNDDESRGEQSRENEPTEGDRSDSESREAEGESTPASRRLYRPVGEDPDAARARFRRRVSGGRGSGRRAERDEWEHASRSQLRARTSDAGRVGHVERVDPNARSQYPPWNPVPFDDERETTGPREGEYGWSDRRSDRISDRGSDRRPDRHAHPWADAGPSGQGGFGEEGFGEERSGGERSDGGRYDRWRLLEELEARTGSAERDARGDRRDRSPY